MRRLVVLVLVAASAFVVYAAISPEPVATAETCGTFDVTPGDGANARPPVRHIIVEYHMCNPGWIVGVGISVDGEINPTGFATRWPFEVFSVAQFYERRPLSPGVHTVVVSTFETDCPRDCPIIESRYEWTFTVGGKLTKIPD